MGEEGRKVRGLYYTFFSCPRSFIFKPRKVILGTVKTLPVPPYLVSTRFREVGTKCLA